MRVLLLPRIHSSQSATGCSSFNVWFWYLRQMAEAGKVAVEVVLPDGVDASDVEGAKFKISRRDQPRLRWIEGIDLRVEKMFAKQLVDADVVVTTKTLEIPYYDVAQHERQWGMNIPQTLPIVGWAGEGPADEHIQVFDRPASIALQALAVLNGALFFNSAYDKKVFVDKVRGWFSPSIVSRLVNGPVVPPVVEDNRIDLDFHQKLRAERRAKDPTVVFFHAGTNPPKRRTNLMMDVFLETVGRGVPLRYEFYSQKDIADTLPKHPAISLRTPTPHEELLGLFHRGDIIYYGVDYVGTALVLWEAILSGMVPLLMTEPWQLDRVPPDYFFSCSSPKDLREKGLFLIKNLGSDFVEAERVKIYNYVSDRVRVSKMANPVYQELCKAVAQSFNREKYEKSSFTDLARQSAAAGVTGTTKEVAKHMASLSRKGIKLDDILSPPAFRRLMQVGGYRDTCESGECATWVPGKEDWL